MDTEYFYYIPKYKMFEKHGWGTGLGTSEERLADIVTHPENWQIAGRIEEREWLKEREINNK